MKLILYYGQLNKVKTKQQQQQQQKVIKKVYMHLQIFYQQDQKKRDKIGLEKALNTLQSNFATVKTRLPFSMKRKKGQKISFEPINLHKNNAPLSDGLKFLCSKGPSYVPVPPHGNWFQLQKLQKLLVLTDFGIHCGVACSFLTRNKMISVKIALH